MNDWNRVSDASTLLHTQWTLSDNRKSDLSKTCSLTIDLRLVAYIWEMKRIDDLAQERIWSLWNWVRVNLSLRFLVRRVTDERFFPDADRVTMTQRSYHDENFTVTGALDDVVLVMSCADVEIALKYLTTFVVTSVCQLLRRTLYPGVFVIDDIDVSSDASPSTDDT